MPGHIRGCSTIDGWVDAVKLSYNVMKGPECFVSTVTSVVLTEECNVVVNSEELIGAIEYLLQ